jgi:aminoglycoside phosphotransferase (APT) family kinase protein
VISGTPGADAAVVGPYLAGVLGDAAWQQSDVELISGGKSNLTYRVTSAAGTVVLRRPPLSTVLPTAHDMVREHRVISALVGTDVPVPRTLHLCTDESVLGAPFYVMSEVDGHIVRGTLPPGYATKTTDRQQMSDALLDVLAALHAVDPAEVGLADFGRPAGFLDRNLRRWVRQWEASRASDLPPLDRLAADLAATLPVSPPPTVVHGDYRLDNVLFDRHDPARIRAVLDWELSTVGDPLTDLGLLLVYWAEPGDESAAAHVVGAVTALPGFPTRAALADGYARRTGRDLTALPWYISFGCFKLAVVVAGIAARVRQGAMVGPGFDGVGDAVVPLVERGRATLSSGGIG